MNLFTAIPIITSVIFAIGCAPNDRYINSYGNCISCQGKTIAKKRNEQITDKQTKYTVLSWKEMMLEGLYRDDKKNFMPYGEDYLKYKMGIKSISLKNNEIRYRKKITQSVSDLESDFKNHSLEDYYQITASSQLGKYDLEKHSFPIRFPKQFSLKGNNNMKRLPKEIVVYIENADKLPHLQISPEKAEAFLTSRKNSRGIYIRYIVKITNMITSSKFNSKVVEVQFIDIKPSVITQQNKEKHMPFKSIKI